MAEYERPAHFRQGHLFDSGAIRLDLWRLLTSFLAEKRFSQLSEPELDYNFQPLLGLYSDFAETEMTRILLSSAAGLRVLDDRDGRFLDQIVDPCGELQSDINNPEVVPLTLREACNKLLHAERINFDLERLDGGDIAAPGFATFLNPTIYLYGTHRRAQWRAVLDIVSYIRSAAIAL
jgi:hypothetical protein